MENNNKLNNIVVVANPRTGSELLGGMLNSHHAIVMQSELFNSEALNDVYGKKLARVIYKNPYAYVRMVEFYDTFRTSKKGFGFKVLVYQMPQLRKFLNLMHQKHFQIISLTRENHLKQALSYCIAFQTKQWVNFNHQGSDLQPIHLAPESVAAALDEYKKNLDIQAWAVKPFNPIHVVYEKDLVNETLRRQLSMRICEKMNWSFEPMHAPNALSDKRTDAERISNFESILQYLKLNGYENDVDTYYRLQAKK